MRTGLLILGTVALMIACGVSASVAVTSHLMTLGMKRHDNYEYYGQTPAVALIVIAGTLGLAAPGLIVWWLHHNHWRVSLRGLLIAMMLIAFVLGAFVFVMRLTAML